MEDGGGGVMMGCWRERGEVTCRGFGRPGLVGRRNGEGEMACPALPGQMGEER